MLHIEIREKLPKKISSAICFWFFQICHNFCFLTLFSIKEKNNFTQFPGCRYIEQFVVENIKTKIKEYFKSIFVFCLSGLVFELRLMNLRSATSTFISTRITRRALKIKRIEISLSWKALPLIYIIASWI